MVWNAAIWYFREKEIRQVLEKIARTPGMKLSGMLPRANGWVGHKTEFADSRSVEMFLRQYFEAVTVREVDEGTTVTFYVQAPGPLQVENSQ